MPPPKSRSFTKKVELDREFLAGLLQGVADRAYLEGYNDGKRGVPSDTGKVKISEKSLCKIK